MATKAKQMLYTEEGYRALVEELDYLQFLYLSPCG